MVQGPEEVASSVQSPGLWNLCQEAFPMWIWASVQKLVPSPCCPPDEGVQKMPCCPSNSRACLQNSLTFHDRSSGQMVGNRSHASNFRAQAQLDGLDVET
mmetsp:Transcript_20066/g.35603  ORF Transcript_20066/g.35603 Transcript_20066/m.35603 type:complete len:100 (-) Transcript_20066:111-410(-)